MLHSATLDNFFNDADYLKEIVVNRDFLPHKNAVDGVEYPGIQVPGAEMDPAFLAAKLAPLFPGKEVKLTEMFYRLSLFGDAGPNQVHVDANMGQYGLIVYLSDPVPGLLCGTSILEHGSKRMPTAPKNQFQWDLWQADAKNPMAWDAVSFCPMKFNRAFVVRADLWHRAEPIGGFGADRQDGRLIFGAFFNVE